MLHMQEHILQEGVLHRGSGMTPRYLLTCQTQDDNRQYLHGSVELLVQAKHLSSQIAVFGESVIQSLTENTVSSV